MFWGEDKDDRSTGTIFHAGVEGLSVKTIRDGFVDLETVADLKRMELKGWGMLLLLRKKFNLLHLF